MKQIKQWAILILLIIACNQSAKLIARDWFPASVALNLPGDANCDGVVNVLDVISTVDYILGYNPEPFCIESADVNGDGIINVVDVIASVNIILGGSTFECGASTMSDYDGNTYTTVQIGEQCWMMENLKTSHYRNGTPIEFITDPTQWINDSTGAYTWYNNDINWKDSYGALYNWHAVNNANGLCPEGWKVPSDHEFNILVLLMDPDANPNTSGQQSQIAGGKLKSTKTAPDTHPRWDQPNAASDDFGFGALPGGVRWHIAGNFASLGSHSYFYTASEAPTVGSAWARVMRNADLWIVRFGYDKNAGKSVRCIKDETITAELPVVITAPITDTTSTTAVSGGNVIDDGGASVISRGVVWSTSPGPTFDINEGITNDGSGLGEFTSTMIGLTPETTYYVRAYAINIVGAAYGEELVFSTNNIFVCGTSIISDYDGNIYYTMEIGYQCWMTENLKTTHYSDGSPIDYPGFDNAAWVNNTTGAYAWLQNLPQWKDIYGALYNWHAVNNVKGLCPEGWHVPTDPEWSAMVSYLTMTYDWSNTNDPNGLGNQLKTCRQVGSPLGSECNTNEHPRWNSNPTHYGKDAISFGALPGSARTTTGNFVVLGDSGNWWSSTEYQVTTHAFSRGLYNMQGYLEHFYDHKSFGFSVRCIKDY